MNKSQIKIIIYILLAGVLAALIASCISAYMASSEKKKGAGEGSSYSPIVSSEKQMEDQTLAEPKEITETEIVDTKEADGFWNDENVIVLIEDEVTQVGDDAQDIYSLHDRGSGVYSVYFEVPPIWKDFDKIYVYVDALCDGAEKITDVRIVSPSNISYVCQTSTFDAFEMQGESVWCEKVIPVPGGEDGFYELVVTTDGVIYELGAVIEDSTDMHDEPNDVPDNADTTENTVEDAPELGVEDIY